MDSLDGIIEHIKHMEDQEFLFYNNMAYSLMITRPKGIPKIRDNLDLHMKNFLMQRNFSPTLSHHKRLASSQEFYPCTTHVNSSKKESYKYKKSTNILKRLHHNWF